MRKKSNPNHGELLRYKHGCRCDLCRNANRLKYTPTTLIGPIPLEHGTTKAYRYYSCRCALCKRANADYCKAQRKTPIGAAKLKASDRARRAAATEFMRSLKTEPCTDCGVTYPPYVMDFDHVRGDKLFTIGMSTQTKSKQQILDEAAKCDVVCANCHRKRTYERANPGVWP